MVIYQVFSSDIKISKISQCQKNFIDLQRLKCQNNKHSQQKQSKKMKLKKVCTKHLLLQYLNSIRLGPSFLYNEAFSFKKKIRKNFFCIYTSV